MAKSAVEWEVGADVNFDEPKRYSVVMLNDDYTTMEFVVEVLMRVFHKSQEQAMALMQTIHQKGRAVCGIFPYEIAETKALQVRKMAKANSFPLRCIVEEA